MNDSIGGKMITEIVYTHEDGREEVRYRRPFNSPEALELVDQVIELIRKHGEMCPYSFRNVEIKKPRP